MEKTTCPKCGKECNGNKNSDGEVSICINCHVALPIITNNETVPKEVYDELDGGRGEK